jgi:hypothetical protein
MIFRIFCTKALFFLRGQCEHVLDLSGVCILVNTLPDVYISARVSVLLASAVAPRNNFLFVSKISTPPDRCMLRDISNAVCLS